MNGTLFNTSVRGYPATCQVKGGICVSGIRRGNGIEEKKDEDRVQEQERGLGL